MKKEDVDKMTLREAIDYTMAKIIGQGKSCRAHPIDPENPNMTLSCVYGDGKGNHCAIGWLLDEDDEKAMNFRGTLKSLLEREDEQDKYPKLLHDNVEVFSMLQKIHDSIDFQLDFESISELVYDLNEQHGIELSDKVVDEWRAVLRNERGIA
jgi:hypothetical protein